MIQKYEETKQEFNSMVSNQSVSVVIRRGSTERFDWLKSITNHFNRDK